MPFLRSSASPQAVECFFCLSPSLLPPHTKTHDRKGKGRLADVGTKWNWQCDRCGCWNIRDEDGNMASDHPAMHNPALNEHSFALRARPSSSRLPSTSTGQQSTFCRDCLTNQTLIMNLLANYLPDEMDSTFDQLYDDLPRYLSNLHARYPPVCASCQPGVDEILRRSDHRAQTEAWGSALRRGQARRLQGVRAGPGTLEVAVWRVRGLIFSLDVALTWTRGALAYFVPQWLAGVYNKRINGVPLAGGLIAVHALSILWVFWDPYWLRRIRSKGQAKVSGRKVWVHIMLVVLVVRMTLDITVYRLPQGILENTFVMIHGTAAIVEALLLLVAISKLHIREPVALKLVRPVSLAVTPDMTGSTPPPIFSLSTLSLDHAPLSSLAANPIFGQTSMIQSAAGEVDQSEPMDWEPTTSPVQVSGDADDTLPPTTDWDSFGQGKQRMFARQPHNGETGLESLIAGWGISGASQDDQSARGMTSSVSSSRGVVLDESALRTARIVLFASRAFVVMGMIVVHDYHLTWPWLKETTSAILHGLLALETMTSVFSFLVALVTNGFTAGIPLSTVVFASEMGIRATALLAPGYPLLSNIATPLASAAALGQWQDEAGCAAWTILSIIVLLST